MPWDCGLQRGGSNLHQRRETPDCRAGGWSPLSDRSGERRTCPRVSARPGSRAGYAEAELSLHSFRIRYVMGGDRNTKLPIRAPSSSVTGWRCGRMPCVVPRRHRRPDGSRDPAFPKHRRRREWRCIVEAAPRCFPWRAAEGEGRLAAWRGPGNPGGASAAPGHRWGRRGPTSPSLLPVHRGPSAVRAYEIRATPSARPHTLGGPCAHSADRLSTKAAPRAGFRWTARADQRVRSWNHHARMRQARGGCLKSDTSVLLAYRIAYRICSMVLTLGLWASGWFSAAWPGASKERRVGWLLAVRGGNGRHRWEVEAIGIRPAGRREQNRNDRAGAEAGHVTASGELARRR
jgi:hypothetical protein